MQLPLQNFTTIVGNAVASVQGAAAQLLDLTVGSTLRAILEANASLALWMQWLIVLVLQTTRASTSTAGDLDTWMADFSVMRLPAVAAGGQVEFSRFVATGAAIIPLGTPVRTADGSQTFSVIEDPVNPAWQASSNAYSVAAGVASVTVPVAAAAPGAAGNVQAASITLLAAAIPGVDTVNNSQPLTGGADAESDAALRGRFQLFLATRSRATPLAVGSAVLATRQGLTYTVAENLAPDGLPLMGSFVVTVDDGTGAPSGATLAAAAVAVETMRPVGTTFSVQPPTVLSVAISMVVTAAPGYDHDAVATNVAQAVTAFVDALPIGKPLPYSRIVQVAYDASPGVANVQGLLVDGVTSDVAATSNQVIKSAIVQVS